MTRQYSPGGLVALRATKLLPKTCVTKRLSLVAVAALIMSAGLVNADAFAASTPVKPIPLTTLKIQTYGPALIDLPVAVGISTGIYRANHLNVQAVPVLSGPLGVAAV